MDKGDVSGIRVFAVIILILLVLIPIIIFSTKTPISLSKNILVALGLGEKEENNDEAIAGFNKFRSKLIECSKYEQDNCLCDAPLSDLDSGHLLTASRKDIKIEAIKEQSKVTLVKEDIGNTACYFSGGRFSLVDFLEIKFDGNGVYVDSESLFGGNLRLKSKNNIYKRAGNLCFIGEGEENLPGKCENRKI